MVPAPADCLRSVLCHGADHRVSSRSETEQKATVIAPISFNLVGTVLKEDMPAYRALSDEQAGREYVPASTLPSGTTMSRSTRRSTQSIRSPDTGSTARSSRRNSVRLPFSRSRCSSRSSAEPSTTSSSGKSSLERGDGGEGRTRRNRPKLALRGMSRACPPQPKGLGCARPTHRSDAPAACSLYSITSV